MDWLPFPSEPYDRLLKGLESGFLRCPLLVPKHLRNGANSGIESVSCSPPAASGFEPSRGRGELCLCRAVRDTTFLFRLSFPSVSLDVPGCCCCCCWSSCCPPPPPLHLLLPPPPTSVSPQWRGVVFVRPPWPPRKLSYCGITDRVAHREVQGHNREERKWGR